jgi:hypothetical protein
VTVRKGRDRPAATRAAVRPAAARAAAPPVAARPAPARATSAVPTGTTGHDRGRCFPLADAVAIALPIAFNLWMPKDWYVRYGCRRTSNAPGRMPFGFRRSSPWRHDGSLATKSRDRLSNRSRRVVAPEPAGPRSAYGCALTGMLATDADGRGCSLGGFPSPSPFPEQIAIPSNRLCRRGRYPVYKRAINGRPSGRRLDRVAALEPSGATIGRVDPNAIFSHAEALVAPPMRSANRTYRYF